MNGSDLSALGDCFKNTVKHVVLYCSAESIQSTVDKLIELGYLYYVKKTSMSDFTVFVVEKGQVS